VSSVPKNLGTNEAEAERSSPAAARASGSPPARPPAPRGSSGSEFSQRRKARRNYISEVGTQPKEGDGDTRNVAWTSGRQAGRGGLEEEERKRGRNAIVEEKIYKV